MPSSALTLFQSAPEALAEKKINLASDTFRVALCAAANAPVAGTDEVLADLTAASLTNLADSSLTVASSAHSGAVYTWDLADKSLTASGGSVGPFRYIVVYSDTATNDDLIGYLDYGSDITLADGETLTVTFNASGVITITIT